MKGFSYSVGSYNVTAERETVNQLKGTGIVNVTTKRILFKSPDKHLTIPMTSIIEIQPYKDAVMIAKATGNPYTFALKEGAKMYQYVCGAIRNS
jgi:hypothetical protein